MPARRFLPTALLSVMLAACASGTASGGADASAVVDGTTPITVANNNGVSAGAATIFLVPQVGVRAQLGQVSPGDRRTFGYRATPGNYRLQAIFVTGSERQSEMFRIYADASVRWDMSTNRVVVGRR